MHAIKPLVEEHKKLVIGARRDLHRIPETAYTEEKTSQYLAGRLEELGLPVRTGVARFGVVADMQMGSPGKTLLLRADMDALPLEEQTGLSFASQHAGVMHACGHDNHMAMVLGAAAVLNRIKAELKGHIRFVFQPAEEGPGGAEPMIAEGVMQNPRVDYSLGCHVWPALPAGTVGVRGGPLMAAMDRFDLKIIGRGGHGAMPHLCVDAVDVGVQVVNSLQRIVSRQMNPVSPTVVTVGGFHAGGTFNIIADQALLCGTTRTFDRGIWADWPRKMERIIGGVCDSMGAEFELQYAPGYPPTVNDAEMAAIVRRCAGRAVGPQNVLEPELTMTGEDMAFYLEASKGCFFFLGAGREGGAPLHNARFDPPEEILTAGVETFCRTALDLLR